MTMKIITGYTGTKHITPADDAGLYKAIFGEGDFVLRTGSQLAATIESATEVRIADGELVMQGRYARNEGHEMVPVANGTQGMYRNDLIVARYAKNISTSVESIELVVITGTATSGTASDPDYNTGDIENGETRDFPLYRVKLSGITIEAVEQLWESPALPIKALGIEHGGTGASNASVARQNINYIGSNPIAGTSDDTPANWATLGTGYTVFTKEVLKAQPNQYGFVENIVAGNSISQRFISTNAGVWHRTGNVNTGWNNHWHDFEVLEQLTTSTDNPFENTLSALVGLMVDASVRQIQFYDPQGLYDNKFIGTLWRYGEKYAALDAFTYTGLSARKTYYNGVWSPWEWINPPMLAGVEYRTVKRFENKPVYARYVDLGKLPSSGNKGWPLQGLHIDKVVDFKVVAYKTAGTHKMQLPYINDSGEIVASARLTEESGYDGTYIKVFAHSTFSDYTGQAYIEYTKA